MYPTYYMDLKMRDDPPSDSSSSSSSSDSSSTYTDPDIDYSEY